METARPATPRMNRHATKQAERETSASTETYAFQKISANKNTEPQKTFQLVTATKMLHVLPKLQIPKVIHQQTTAFVYAQHLHDC